LFVKPAFSVSLIEIKPTPQNIFFSGLDAYSHQNYKQATAEFSKLTRRRPVGLVPSGGGKGEKVR
jgi:hypothetical protein